MKGRTVRRTGPLGVDGPRDEDGQMDASGAALAFTYSIVSLGEILRAERAMVKRSAKAHFFFLTTGCGFFFSWRKKISARGTGSKKCNVNEVIFIDFASRTSILLLNG